MQFFDEMNGVSLCNYSTKDVGHMLRTTDGGTTWNEDKQKFDKIQTFYFLNKSVGWANGLGYYQINRDSASTDVVSIWGIYFTKDGGNTWDCVFDSVCVNDIYFLDENNGWAVGDYNFIISTSDGGKSWKRQQIVQNENNTVSMGTSTYDYRLKSVRFLDSKKGIIVGPSAILYTEDGGERWIPRFKFGIGNYSIYQTCSISVLDDDDVWITGVHLQPIHFDGNNFNELEIKDLKSIDLIDKCQPEVYPQVVTMAFSDSKNGWIIGNYGCVFYTSNGGKKWKQIPIKVNENAMQYCEDNFSRKKLYTSIAPIIGKSCVIYGWDQFASINGVESVLVKIN